MKIATKKSSKKPLALTPKMRTTGEEDRPTAAIAITTGPSTVAREEARPGAKSRRREKRGRESEERRNRENKKRGRERKRKRDASRKKMSRKS